MYRQFKLRAIEFGEAYIVFILIAKKGKLHLLKLTCVYLLSKPTQNNHREQRKMNPIIQMLKELNVSEEKINELFQALTDNPLMAMGIIQQLGIPPEKLQAIMGIVMTQPELIKEAVEELGLDFAKVAAAKSKLKEGL